MSAFQPCPDLVLVADCIYYEEVRILLLNFFFSIALKPTIHEIFGWWLLSFYTLIPFFCPLYSVVLSSPLQV